MGMAHARAGCAGASEQETGNEACLAEAAVAWGPVRSGMPRACAQASQVARVRMRMLLASTLLALAALPQVCLHRRHQPSLPARTANAQAPHSDAHVLMASCDEHVTIIVLPCAAYQARH